MTPQEVPHGWSAEALLNKSQLYAEVMLSYPHGDWKFTLWSTLSLELLARAALSNFSPTLLADSKGSWHNLLYSLGNQPKAKNFTPKSIDISEVFGRLQELKASAGGTCPNATRNSIQETHHLWPSTKRRGFRPTIGPVRSC